MTLEARSEEKKRGLSPGKKFPWETAKKDAQTNMAWALAGKKRKGEHSSDFVSLEGDKKARTHSVAPRTSPQEGGKKDE